MKISIAQTSPIKGDIAANIVQHKRFVELASSFNACALFFPELSLTGYEPELAQSLAISIDDDRLDDFQQLSNNNKITIGIGVPTKTRTGTLISMIVFQPNQNRKSYSKQQLHPDELLYFENGQGQLILTVDNKQIAPAICYESLEHNHANNAFLLGAEIYLASVAKPQHGVSKGLVHYPEVARKHSMSVLMVNSVGFCDNFMSMGNSSVWTKQGKLAGQMDDNMEGLLLFDTETEEVNIIRL